jgi:hypothetical protein
VGASTTSIDHWNRARRSKFDGTNLNQLTAIATTPTIPQTNKSPREKEIAPCVKTDHEKQVKNKNDGNRHATKIVNCRLEDELF